MSNPDPDAQSNDEWLSDLRKQVEAMQSVRDRAIEEGKNDAAAAAGMLLHELTAQIATAEAEARRTDER